MFGRITNRGARRSSKAFTLVELLVVVSIIALLIAILLPSLKKARQAAKRIACNANVRGIAQAGLTYATDDEKEFAIPIGTRDGNAAVTESYPSYVNYGGKSGLGVQGTANGSIWSGFNDMGSIDRPLNYVLYKGGFAGPTTSLSRSGSSESWTADAKLDLEVFHCPGDKGFPGMHYNGWKIGGLSGYDHFGTSYSCNPYLVGTGAGSPLDSNSMYLRPMSRVPNPSNTILYSEFAMRFAVFANNSIDEGGDYDQSGCYWPWPIGDKIAHGHHGQPWHFTVSFGDGHATWAKIKGHGNVSIGTQDSKMPPSCQNGYCQCILQRGLDWQVDTLPADLVPTHKLRTASNGTLVAQQDGAGGSDDIFSIQDK